MSGNAPVYDVRVPGGLEEALEILGREPGAWRPLAGGTDLMVLFASGRLKDTRFLDLGGLADLRGIEVDDEEIRLGALTTFTELRRHPAIREAFPNLADGARLTGALAIQNRGTLGGNLANGSPAADTPPSLLAYGAEVELRSREGARWVPCDAFFTGYKRNALLPGELITRIRLPRQPEGPQFHYFRKVGARKAQAISKTCLSAWGRREDGRLAELRLGLGSVAPMPFRARRTEDFLTGQPLDRLPVDEACRLLAEEIAPIDDIRSTAHYRRVVTTNLLAEALESLGGMALG